ncbi:hypothetical protein CP533_2432 [Ophiocordyceps camponoti-saundersi (nom. inval.)]|nr:hypothetical protein CP533_2432 [Ophiocordyceps camponoti-saundersi (nom. inval.)]
MLKSPGYQAVAAAAGLVAIQVGLGIILKLAQNDGSYSFSTSGSVSLSELGKLILAIILFYRECSLRVARGVKPRTQRGGGDYESLPLSSTGDAVSDQDQGSRDEDDDENESHEDSVPETKLQNASMDAKLNLVTFWRYFRGEVTREKQAGFYILALCYTLINNSIFLSYYLADPGTIQLSKSSGGLVTAVIMVVTLKTAISRIQWAMVFLQVFGMVLTQYKPGIGSTYPATTYAILFFQVFIGASSAVYNQRLLKTDNNSMHADNMVLYAFGTVINLICHIFIFTMTANEPSFFEGYSDIRAILVVVSHAFVGVAITYVYKYADAVVKCLATAVATGILLYISPILFGSELGSFVILGTLIVFASSWVYMKYPVSAPSTTQSDDGRGHRPSQLPKHWVMILGLLTVVTVGIVTSMALFRDRYPPTHGTGSEHVVKAPVHEPEMVNGTTAAVNETKTISPFHNALAMVRWNSVHPERVAPIMKYEPFFDTIHISMPDMIPDHPPTFYNWTHDQFQGTFTIYHQVAKMMQLALANKPDVKGLMYFHFDAWLDPFGWNDTNWDNMWMSYGGPHHTCMTKTETYPWWGWNENFHQKAMNATLAVQELGLSYKVDPKSWCLGWSDIYYVPRRFFADYILLADVFFQHDVFHEVAIPTMLNIINNSQPSSSTLDLVRDCWGSCCDTIAGPKDVLKSRCGHRLDYLNQPAPKEPILPHLSSYLYRLIPSSTPFSPTISTPLLRIAIMEAVPDGSLILVTGVNGYIGSHVAEQLLEFGYRVRGTVRDVIKATYMHALFDEKYGPTSFETHIVEDMAVSGAFDEAIKGCAGVVHVASDLSIGLDAHKIIPMVVEGGIAVYAASKALAERECWRFMEDERPSFVLNAVLPNCNIGRILYKEQPASTGGWYRKFWEGDESILVLLENLACQYYVNTTDTAILHVAALREEDVAGERLFACAEPFNFNDTMETFEKLRDQGYGDSERIFPRIANNDKDLNVFDTKRAEELLQRYNRPGFANLEECLKEVIESCEAFADDSL